MVASIEYMQSATLLANQSSVAVTLDHALADSSYNATPELPYQTRWYISSKTASGFTFNVETTNVSNQTITFIIFHE